MDKPLLLVGVKDVAEALGLSLKAVRTLAKARALPVTRRADGAMVSSRDELAAWVRLNMPKAETVPPERRAQIADWPLGEALDAKDHRDASPENA